MMRVRTVFGSAIAVMAAGGLLMAAPAAAQRSESGNIRGRVTQPAVTARDERRPSVSDLGQTAHAPIDRSRAVVYLDAGLLQAFDPLPTRRMKMDQRNQAFEPHLIAITVGTTVDFPNDDPMFHNVMSLARGNAFDLGRYPKGRSRSVRFDTPGLVPVVCDIHAHMSAYILVFNHPFFAITDADGRYSIPNIPAGTYTLKVWSELGTVEPRRITIAANTTIDADFQVVK
jgi:plastocyanin